MRTPDEILARIEAVRADDPFGFAVDVLTDALPWEHLVPFLVPEPERTLTEEKWKPLTDETVVGEARGYLTFAIGKIVDHRGISASRSVAKLTEYAWLMGRDDLVTIMTEMGDAQYAQYGAPIVKAFAEGMGWPFIANDDPGDNAALLRMAQGLACSDDGYDCGCGR